ncbi:hypothetical protein [Methylobacterium sp. SI9]|uniref:hypothetical protein n=1 Tax=Methylobacterium guangdongense TaxID=3138811 RepID=UPI00313E7B55
MVWFSIFWLICLTVVLIEVLRAPTLPPDIDAADPDAPRDPHPADHDGERHDPQP